jgi:hypothetical protein
MQECKQELVLQLQDTNDMNHLLHDLIHMKIVLLAKFMLHMVYLIYKKKEEVEIVDGAVVNLGAVNLGVDVK